MKECALGGRGGEGGRKGGGGGGEGGRVEGTHMIDGGSDVEC